MNITKGDLKRLEPPEYLNDNIIDFRIKYFDESNIDNDIDITNKPYYVFSSLFFTKLNEKSNINDTYENVKKWTNKVDIFEKDFLLFPINDLNHWSLFLAIRPGLAMVNYLI